jgi:hypothetical protein
VHQRCQVLDVAVEPSSVDSAHGRDPHRVWIRPACYRLRTGVSTTASASTAPI